MNLFVKILLESSIIMSGFYILYLVFLRNDKNFKFTRIYLIGSLFLSVILPQLRFPLLSINSPEVPIPLKIHDAIQLPEIIISGPLNETTSSLAGINTTTILLIIYLAGVLIFSGRFLYEIYILMNFIYRNPGKVEQHSFYRLIRTGGRIPTSSFFNYLFWDETVDLTAAEKEQILRHEEGHIRQFHSYDILYFEILRIIFWFNPFIHGYRKAIASLHEYLADEHAIKDETAQQYIGLLARQVLRSCNLTINNHFSRSQTVKRIRMIKSDRRRPILLKWGICLVMTSVMFYIFACDTGNPMYRFNSASDRFPLMQYIKIIEPSEIFSSSYRERVDIWINENADKPYVIISSTAPVKAINELSTSNDWKITSSYTDEQNGSPLLYGIVCYEPGYKQNILQNDEVFSQVDVSPAPEKGIKSFYQYIINNLQYPETARTNGIEGKVFVEFIVTDSGILNEVKVLKGFDTECDEEAVRVISQSPKWVPGFKNGMAVNVKMVLPITFALN